MATGVQSSASSAVLRPGFNAQPSAQTDAAAANAGQQQTAPAVLRSGEKQASTMEALKNPNSKVYYHRVAGAKFIMPDGLELQFLGGRLVTDDPAICAELDKIANKTTSMVFTQKEGIAAVERQESTLAKDASNTEGIDGKQG